MKRENEFDIRDWKGYLLKNGKIALAIQYIALIVATSEIIVMALIWAYEYIPVIVMFSIPISALWLIAIQRLRYFKRVQLPIALDHLQPIDPPSEKPAQGE